MEKLYHINLETGRPNQCRATAPEKCPYFDKENNTPAPHFDNKPDARKYIEKELNKEYKNTQILTKNSLDKEQKEQSQNKENSNIDKDEKISYSFMKKMEKLEEEYKDLPKKFLTKDLRTSGNKRLLPEETEKELLDEDFKKNREKYGHLLSEEALNEVALTTYSSYNSYGTMYPFITKAITETSENNLSEERVQEIIKNLNIENLQKFENDKRIGKKYGETVYTGTLKNKEGVNTTIFISGKSLNSKNFSKRKFRSPSLNKDLGLEGYSTWVDIRSLSGAEKIKKNTDINILEDTTTPFTRYYEIVKKLEQKQTRGQEYINQKNYIKSTTGKVATAYMDKKNPDKEHQKMMKNAKLNKIFKKVEIDNDVEGKEYEDFEKSYEEIENKLPKIPDNRKPTLRIRKLGRQKAAGLFYPTHNTIAIDVRDSGSTIHELAHYYDFMLKDNISLSNEFSEIKNEYTKNLKIPDTVSKTSKFNKEYYNTNTEVHSRLFEIWAYERKGINNRLLNKERFNNFDYAPIMKNPVLKKKGFDFLDKIYSE